MDGQSISVCCQQLNILASFMLPHNIFNNNNLTLNIPSLTRQRCLSSWGPRGTPWFFLISQLFDAVDYSNYVFWVSETIIQ